MIATTARSRPTDGWLTLVLAVASLGAAGIHFAVIGEHFSEYVPFGVFFATAAWIQAVWAVVVVAQPRRPILWAGLIGNAAIVGLWIASRTVGLPIGPESGQPEALGWPDALSSLLEGVVVAGCILGLVRENLIDHLPRRNAWLLTGGIAILIAGSTTIALASTTGAPHHSEHGAEAAEGSESVEGLQPTLSRVDLGDGRLLQALADTSTPGSVQFHLTFFDPQGNGLAMRSMTLRASRDGFQQDVPVSQLEPEHFTATADLEPGAWSMQVEGTTSAGAHISGVFPVEAN